MTISKYKYPHHTYIETCPTANLPQSKRLLAARIVLLPKDSNNIHASLLVTCTISFINKIVNNICYQSIFINFDFQCDTPNYEV